jgi:hypothetical protein
MANWKVKVQSIIGRKSRSSFNIEVVRQEWFKSRFELPNCTTPKESNPERLITLCGIRKEEAEITDKRFVHKSIRNV